MHCVHFLILPLALLALVLAGHSRHYVTRRALADINVQVPSQANSVIISGKGNLAWVFFRSSLRDSNMYSGMGGSHCPRIMGQGLAVSLDLDLNPESAVC